MSNKKRILAILLLVTSLACTKSEIKNDSIDEEQVIFDDSVVFDLGNIYIGDDNYINSLNVNDNDVLIVDQRDSADPNIKIIDSYRISDSNAMDYILNYLINYENDNPSNWDRTFESMKKEWIMHNLAYSLDYEVKRSKDVDLNNADESKYVKKLVKE